MNRALAAGALAALVGCSDPEAHTIDVEATVTRRDGTPVPRAVVTIDGKRIPSDDAGRFTVTLAPGAHLARVEIAGERPRAATLFSVGEPATVVVGPAPEPGAVDLFFAGDTMFGRRYEDPDVDGLPGDGWIDPDDPGAGVPDVIEFVRPWIEDADLATVNLESTVTDRGMIHPRKPYTVRSGPGVLDALAEVGVDVVTLGNNHVYDFLDEGLARMLELLDEAKVARVGAGRDWDEAVEPLLVHANGVRVAIVSATTIDGRSVTIQGPDGVEVTPDLPPYYTAERGVDKGGALALTVVNVEESLRRARVAEADLEILVIHGGLEYSERPSETVRDVARAAIDRGVDLVIAHHPHVIQPIEVYRGVAILFSIGNFVFDGNFVETMPGIVVEARARATGIDEIVVKAMWLDDYVPRPLAGPDALAVLRKLAALSAPLGTTLRIDPGGAFAVVEVAPTPPGPTRAVEISAPLRGPDAGPAWSAPIAIDDAISRPRFVQGATPSPGVVVVFGRDLLGERSFDDGGADDRTDHPIGWDVFGREKSIERGTLRLLRSDASARPSTAKSTGRHPIRPGRTLTLSGRWRVDEGAGDAEAQIAFFADRDRDADPIAIARATRRTAGGFEPFDVTMTAPPGARFVQAELSHLVPTRGDEGVVEYDDAAMILWGVEPSEATHARLGANAPGFGTATVVTGERP